MYMNQFHLFLCAVICTAMLLVGCKEAPEDFAWANQTDAIAENSFLPEDANLDTENTAEAEQTSEPTDCYVYVSGAVYKPGVYHLQAGSRVFEAIERAGGLKENAYEGAVNQAELVSDGQMIVIPTYDEWNSQEHLSQNAADFANVDDGLVNINTADETKLCSLPGIGLSRAQAIIAYREENGAFSDIAQIQNVTGIKEGLYSKIKDKIKIAD